jgi:hypothetical protein
MSLVPVVHAFGLARSASEPSEDAYAVDVDAARFALADGASSAWRAGDWAAQLVAAWVAKPPSRARGGDQGSLVRWLEQVRVPFTGAATPGERTWFAEAAAERGAHAAFLGVTLTGLAGKRARWRATAVGDVCLLHVRDDRLVRSLPLDDPSAFGSHPDLLSSLPGGPVPMAMVAEGPLQTDDMLVLASDALAAFLLRLDPEVWPAVQRLDTAGFEQLVAEGIACRLFEPDDATLVRIVLRAAPEDGAGDGDAASVGGAVGVDGSES